MNAMILAAGKGERLRPLTAEVPKPALPVLGRPMIGLVLADLVARGVTRIAMNLHHKGEVLRAMLGDGADLGVEDLTYFDEPGPILGTGGGIKNAEGVLRGSGTILVRNSDFLADIDLDAVIASHLRAACPATLVLVPQRPGYTAVDVDRAGRVVSFGGKPAVDPATVAWRATFTGCHLIEEEVLDAIPASRPSDIVREVYMRLAAGGRLNAYRHDRLWWEFGTPREYLEGSLYLIGLAEKERKKLGAMDPVKRIGKARVAFGPGAEIQREGVTLAGRVAIGFAAHVGEDVSIEDSVVMPECWIGPGCRLRRVIVATGAEVPAGLTIEDALIGPDADPGAELPPGTEREHGCLVRRS